MSTAESLLEERIARLERSRNTLSIVTAAAVLAAAIALVLPFLDEIIGGKEMDLVLHNAVGEPTIVLSGETGTAELHGVSILNDQNKVRGAFVPTKLGAELTLFNSEDQPVVVLNNSSPSQGGRLSLFGIGDRAAFFGGTVTDEDFGMEIRMRPGVSAVAKMVNEVPFFSLSDLNGEALIQIEDGSAELFANRISVLGPDSLPRVELVGTENGGSVALRDANDTVRASIGASDETGGHLGINSADGAQVWQAP
jgi:hypothetical protein